MPSHFRNAALAMGVMLAALSTSACERENRRFAELTPSSAPIEAVTVTPFEIGLAGPRPHVAHEYEENGYAVSEGKRLYSSFNCVGCHFHGGGGIGPALMDDEWIYGSDPDQIFLTIVQGRPNGMPSFGEKIPRAQIWQIVAYVRSLSGLLAKDVAPSRDDHLYAKPAEQQMESPKVR